MFQLVNSGEDVLFVYYKEDRNVFINFNKGIHYRYLIDYVLNQAAFEFKAFETLLLSKGGHIDYFQICNFFYDRYKLKIKDNNFYIETHQDIEGLYQKMLKSIEDFPSTYEEYKKHCNVLLAISSDEEYLQIIESNDIFFGDFVTNFDPKKFYECVFFLAKTHNGNF